MKLADFYSLSAALTGYPSVKLIGTGVGETYLDVLSNFVPGSILLQLSDTFTEISQQGCEDQDDLIRINILSSASLGPVARNIIKMWYCSMWYTLPVSWQDTYGQPTQTPGDYPENDFVISENAYIQGLAWDALNAHPMGAKQPGWADWAFPPKGVSEQIDIKHIEQ